MAEAVKYPSGEASGVEGTTWTNLSGLNSDEGTALTWTNATRNANGQADSGAITFTDGDIPAGSTIESVTLEWEDQNTGLALLEQAVTPYLGETAGTKYGHAGSSELTPRTQDITAARPGGGAWTLEDLKGGTLKVRVLGDRGNSTTQSVALWDYVRVKVVYAPPEEGPQEKMLTPATETDTTQALSYAKPKKLALSASSEVDIAPAVTAVKPIHVSLGPASEADASIALTHVKPIYRALSLAVETDTAVAAVLVKQLALIPGAESDDAPVLAWAKPIYGDLLTAVETDTVPTISFIKPLKVTVVSAAETDTAQTLSIKQEAQQITLTTAVEISSAVAVSFIKPIRKTLAVASELDETLPTYRYFLERKYTRSYESPNSGVVRTSIGAANPAAASAYTMAAIVRFGATGNQYLMCRQDASHINAAWWDALGFESNYLRVWPLGGSTLAPPRSEWLVVAVSKPSGSSKALFSYYRFSTGQWSHAESTSAWSATNSAAPAEWQLGRWNAGEQLNGRYQAAAVWHTNLSQAQVESLAIGVVYDWISLGPKALWFFDQPNLTEELRDLTGGGANQISRITTAVYSETPPEKYYPPVVLTLTSAVESDAAGLLEGSWIQRFGLTPAVETDQPVALSHKKVISKTLVDWTYASVLDSVTTRAELLSTEKPAGFTLLPWSGEDGSFNINGWAPDGYVGGYATGDRSGNYWSTATFAGSAAVSVRRPVEFAAVGLRQFDLWLHAGVADALADGYQLVVYQPANESPATKFTFRLRRWIGASESLLKEVTSVEMLSSGRFALVKDGILVQMWVKRTSTSPWKLVGQAQDTTFTEGYVALGGNGSNPRLSHLAAEELAPIGLFEVDVALPLSYEVLTGISLEPATEIDAAAGLSVLHPQRLTLSVAVEADMAPGLVWAKFQTLTPSDETDEALTLSVSKPVVKTVASVTEMDSAVAFILSKHRTLDAGTEDDSALALSHVKPKKVSLTSVDETDSSVSLSHVKPIQMALVGVAETDSSVTLSTTKPIHKVLGAALETDAPQALARAKHASVGLAAELDSAVALAAVKPVVEELAPAAELDTAQTLALVGRTQTSIAKVSLEEGETPATREDHKIVIRARKVSGTGTVTLRAALYEGEVNRSGNLETGSLTTELTTYELPISKAAAETITSYTDLAIWFWGYSVTGDMVEIEVAEVTLSVPTSTELPQEIDLNPAVESDYAQPLSYSKPIVTSLSPTSETDEGQSVTFVKPIHKSLVPGVETDAAALLAYPQLVILTPAAETDLSIFINVRKYAALPPASETDTVLSLTRVKRATLPPATETSFAVALTIIHLIHRTLAVASETDAASGLIWFHPYFPGDLKRTRSFDLEVGTSGVSIVSVTRGVTMVIHSTGAPVAAVPSKGLAAAKSSGVAMDTTLTGASPDVTPTGPDWPEQPLVGVGLDDDNTGFEE